MRFPFGDDNGSVSMGFHKQNGFETSSRPLCYYKHKSMPHSKESMCKKKVSGERCGDDSGGWIRGWGESADPYREILRDKLCQKRQFEVDTPNKFKRSGRQRKMRMAWCVAGIWDLQLSSFFIVRAIASLFEQVPASPNCTGRVQTGLRIVPRQLRS